MSEKEIKKHKKFWGFTAEPSGIYKIILASLLFIIVIALYVTISYLRHAENPQDKILPTFGQMGDAMYRMAFEKDPVSGDYLLLVDLVSSLKRIFIGVFTASLLGLLLGLNMGLQKGFEALTSVFLTVISIIPPLAILPIIFISFGVDEFSKIFLIFLGTFPFIARDIYLYTKKTPREQIIKSLTLGATDFQTTYSVIMPQIMPRLIDTTRLSFGAAWLFLIASEAIASTSGLGYRIFLVRRYLSMDIIIPYVFIITVIGYSLDYILKRYIAKKYRWYNSEKV